MSTLLELDAELSDASGTIPMLRGRLNDATLTIELAEHDADVDPDLRARLESQLVVGLREAEGAGLEKLEGSRNASADLRWLVPKDGAL